MAVLWPMVVLKTRVFLGPYSLVHTTTKSSVWSPPFFLKLWRPRAIGWALSGRNRKLPLVNVANVAYVFSLMNAAAIVGLLYFITGKRDVWAGSDLERFGAAGRTGQEAGD